MNVFYDEHRPVYLVDTPGFSDSKISEIEVVNMLRKWALDNHLDYQAKVLYLTPITEMRLPGSRRRTFRMLQKLFEGYDSRLAIVTTMWDAMHNGQTRERAESNFAQLRDETLNEFVENPNTDIIKFTNTRYSALEALDRILDFEFYSNAAFSDNKSSRSALLYQDLHERILAAIQEKRLIESDITQPETRTNANLWAILKRSQRENQVTLTKFVDQFSNFGELPLECREAAAHLRRSISVNAYPGSIKQKVLFSKWAREPETESNGYAEASRPITVRDFGLFGLDASKRSVSKLFKRP